MRKMLGRQALVEALSSEGVRFIFGLPGGQSCDMLYDALYDTPEIKPVLVRHPQAAAFMAYAYARLTGEPGVCHGTVGPGANNLVAGVAEASSGCIPLIALVPQVATKLEGMGALQEFPQLATFSSFTKWSVRINRVDRIPWFIRRAFQIAATGTPGPVFVEVPVDLGMEEAEIPEYVPSIRPLRVRPDFERVKEAGELTLRSRSPVIVAGGGVYLSRAFEELRRFAEMLAIPVLTTASGKGSMVEDHPLYAGLIGIYRNKVSKRIWEESDLVIGVGSRFEQMETGKWLWYPENAKLISINIDPTEVGMNWIPDLAVVGDAKLVMLDLMDYLDRKVGKVSLEDAPRVRSILEAKKEYEAEMKTAIESDATPIKPIRIMKEFRKVLNRGAVICHENGAMDVWSYSQLPVLEAGMDVMPAAQTCLGCGVAGAIGAKLTLPDRQVLCVTGDAAFQIFMKELATAVQHKAPATWAIMNNFSLGWIKLHQKAYNQGRYIATDFEFQPDFVKIAEANRCFGASVESPGEVREAIQRALKANSEGVPSVLDFIIDPQDFTEGFREMYKMA